MKRHTQTLLGALPIGAGDAARLILELTEELGERAQGLERGELMRLLRRTLRAGVSSVEQEEQTVSFEEAAWASIEARRDRRPVTRRDLRTFVRRLLRVEGLARRPLRALSTLECRCALQRAFAGSTYSYRKGRAILHSIFAYGQRQGWCAANPVDAIESPRVHEQEIVPLAPRELARLQRAAEQPQHAPMRLSLHLMLYCGIRPAEVQRLNPATDIDWRSREVRIRPTSSKTGGGRIVPLRAAGRLRHCARIIPPNWARRWRQLRGAAGFVRWVPDVLRHSFASYHAAYFRNLPQLQLEMGHRDLALLRTRYISPLHTRACDLRLFWRSRAIG